MSGKGGRPLRGDSSQEFLREHADDIERLYCSIKAACDTVYWPILDGMTLEDFEGFCVAVSSRRPGQSKRRTCNPTPLTPPLTTL